jgi:hypothetical protein
MAQYSGMDQIDTDGKGEGNYSSTTLTDTKERNKCRTLTAQSMIQSTEASLSEATGSLSNLDIDDLNDLLGPPKSGSGPRKTGVNLSSGIFDEDYEEQGQPQQKTKPADELPRPAKVEIQLIFLDLLTALLTYWSRNHV